ncbi:MAG: glucokinase [Nitrospirae bacterium]|nr:glucokinase [Nitrospirota bacterium]MBI3593356.1 glucokinase [Nitrospirota bacterium]
MILAGDIGGTKVDLAFFQSDGKKLTEVRQETFRSREFGSLDEVIQKFCLNELPRIQKACFGVAGPVVDGRCETTNLPWVVDAEEMKHRFSIQSLFLLNDLEAMAYGTGILAEHETVILNPGIPRSTGNRCVIAAGTGLGEAILFWDGTRFQPSATEGGHSDFAPRNEIEWELLKFLMDQYPRVSFERVLSGPGILNIYRFLTLRREGEEPSWLKESLEKEDPASVISKAALELKSELCIKTIDLFVSIYGAEAGNLALKTMATGGVFIGGGIGTKILKKLREGEFVRSFVNKGRMSSLIKRMPLKVIINEKTALLGAAHYADDFNLARAI